MIRFGELGVELKSGIIFSVIAFFLSIIAGLAGGVPSGIILFRSFVIAPVFFVVGYGIVLVIKKFVPELYELFGSIKVSSEDSVEDIEIPFEDSGNTGTLAPEKADSGFSEFTEKDYDRLQTINDTGLDSALNTSGTKLGKHIIVDNQLNSYEPKLMAQAIRTMMSKDKD